jgi:hypothetical protein
MAVCEKCGKQKTELRTTYTFKEVYENYCLCTLMVKRVIALPEEIVEEITTQEDLVEIMKNMMT